MLTRGHERGCDSRCYTCSCGYEDDIESTIKDAADEIERLRLSLSEARATGRREGLSEAATIIEEGFERGIERKQDTCAHGKFDWDDCEQCAAAAIRAAMEKAAGDPPVGNKDIGERHGDHH